VKRARGIAVAILIASVVDSCSLFRRDPSPASYGSAIVRVENGDQHDVSVFLVQSGQRTRLGTVVALSTSSFEVPKELLRAAHEVQLVADPVGMRGRVASERFVVRAGQRVVWTLDAGLRRSSLGIF
jgi:hypothetical protein